MNWINLACFSIVICVDITLGSPVQEAHIDVDAYLKKYHYLGNNVPDPRIAELADRNMTRARQMALSMFQMKFGLPVTGQPDADTLQLMSKPRCGIPDIRTMRDIPDMSSMMEGEELIAQPYVHEGSRWKKNHLTYKIIRYCADLTREQVDITIAQAFQLWSDVTPLTFTPVTFYEQADIVIQFKDIYDRGYDFDGYGRVLAYAYYPQYGGDASFDDGELWTLESYEGTNLLQVAAHEFGHSLGLSHSYDYTALMYPAYLGYVPNYVRLPYDDTIGIQLLYGSQSRPSVTDYPPTPGPTFAPGEIPDVCNDAKFDAVTYQRIQDKDYTLVFREDYYYALDYYNGVVDGYPHKIQTDWLGLNVDHIDAALTPPWSEENGQWRYLEVTYLFSGEHYYKMVDMRLQGGAKSIQDDFGISGNIDAIFQWYQDGRYYIIKGDKVYRYGTLTQGSPDANYPKPLMSLNHRLYRVDAAFMGQDSHTYFFHGNQYIRFNLDSFTIAEGYPRKNAKGWLKCQ